MKRDKFIHKTIIIIVVISAISCLASASWAATYYVSTSGSDSNIGTSTSTPFKTIQKALDTLKGGDTVNIRVGTYNEALVLKTSGSSANSSSGISANRITIQAYNGEAVTINSGANRAIRLGSSQIGYYTFKNLTFISTRVVYGSNKDSSLDFGVGNSWWGWGPAMDSTPVLDDPSYSPNMTNGDGNGNNGFIIDHCTIFGSIGFMGHFNVVKFCTLEGNESFTNGIMDMTIVSHHNIYENNTIHGYINRGYWGLDNITYDIVSNNTFSNNALTIDHVGADFDCIGQPCHNNSILNNTFYNEHLAAQFENGFYSSIEGNTIYNTDEGIVVINYGAPDGAPQEYRSKNVYNKVVNNIVYGTNKSAIEIITSPGNYVYNNTLDGNNSTESAIRLINRGTSFGSNNTQIGNNIISNNSGGIGIDGNTSNITITNNLFYGNNNNGSMGSSYQTGNPLFVNISNHNYSLLSTSPAIDKGTTPIVAVGFDYMGTIRPQGSAYDIGAYEFTLTPTGKVALSPPSNLTAQ